MHLSEDPACVELAETLHMSPVTLAAMGVLKGIHPATIGWDALLALVAPAAEPEPTEEVSEADAEAANEASADASYALKRELSGREMASEDEAGMARATAQLMGLQGIPAIP